MERCWRDFALKDYEALLRHYTDDVAFEDPLTVTNGKSETKAYLEAIDTALPNWTVVRHHAVADATGFAYEWTIRGSVTGTLGSLKGAGEEIEMRGLSIARFRGDLVASNRDNWDITAVLRQLGVSDLASLEQ
jgi:ketosteroid isomerase-like protein